MSTWSDWVSILRPTVTGCGATPRSSVTPELAGRMTLHKSELIASLGSEADAVKPTLDNSMLGSVASAERDAAPC